MIQRALSHLTYANTVATGALFVALGGGAYAATALPRGSVGPEQIRANAVSGAKLAEAAVDTDQIAPGAVTLSRLSGGVRSRLYRPLPGAQGPQGPAGAQGAQGPAGPAGADNLGARRIRFDRAATTTLDAATALAMPGLKIEAACVLNGSDPTVGLRITSSEDATLQFNFTIDTASDPDNPPPPGDPNGAATANGQVTLTANTAHDLGGPGTQNGTGYFRVMARALLVTPTKTINLTFAELVDATTGRCTVDGTAIPAT